MPARITEFCERTNQPAPSDPGMFVRAALESLACKYQYQLERLETLCDKTFETLHVVGGGTYNQLLCQFTANATGKRVVAGPGEATTLGNVVMQMLALGHIDSLAQGRALVRQSFALQEYEPHDRAAWQDAYGRFKEMLA
jgi:sugar (pentulose or hexulose) kinase